MTTVFKSILTLAIAAFALTGCQTMNSSKMDREIVNYSSANIKTFREVLTGQPENGVNLKGQLLLPKGDGPFPVIMWQHGSGPADSNSLKQWRTSLGKNLTDNGIGLFIADSYSGRGIKSTSRDQSKLSGASRLLDVYRALSVLAAHPRIDADRIGISGNSYGGIIAFRTSHEPYASAALPDGPRFSAHLAFYPTCQTHYERYESTGAPVLILIGEDDDWTLAAPCVGRVEALRQNGADIDIYVYPGAHHGFLSSRPVKYKPHVQVYADCGLRIMLRNGHIRTDYGSTENAPRTEVFGKMANSGCIRKGAHSGRNDAAAEDAMKRTMAFFTKHLQKN